MDDAVSGFPKVDHPAADLLQKRRLFLRGRAPAQDGHLFAAVQHPVAGGAVAHAPAQQLCLPRKLFSPGHARRQHDGLRLGHGVPDADVPIFSGAQGAESPPLLKIRSGGLGVAAKSRQQLRPGFAGEAQIVVYPLRLPERIFLQRVGNHQYGFPPGPDVLGRRQSRRAAAHYQHVIRHRAASLFHAACIFYHRSCLKNDRTSRRRILFRHAP